MLNKVKFGLLFAALVVVPFGARADVDDIDIDVETVDVADVPSNATATDADEMEMVSATAVSGYQVDGSLFQQITDLEQEKVLMQLEKERAQLDLELDRLAAEKIRLHMEIDTLSGRAEQQQQELEVAKAKLEAETAKLEREKEALEQKATAPVKKTVAKSSSDDNTPSKITNQYKLVNVYGTGNQLLATIADLDTGQNKKVSVGSIVGGYTIKSISLDDGIAFVDGDGNIQTLNVISNKNK